MTLYDMENTLTPPWVIEDLQRKEHELERSGLYLPVPEPMPEPPRKEAQEKITIIQL